MSATDDMRRAMLPAMPAELAAALERGEPVWDTTTLQAEFTVEGFAAPYVVARRRADGTRGTLMFTHSPRRYFAWHADA